MKKNEKTINNYLIADITGSITTIFFFIIIFILIFNKLQHAKTYLMYFSGFLSITSLIVCLQTKYGKAQVINKSTKTIAVKDEKTENVENIAPNEVSIDIDGINVDGKIYKIPDGVHAKVTKNNKVKINSLIGTIIYCTMGGLLKTPPDEKWNNLFNK